MENCDVSVGGVSVELYVTVCSDWMQRHVACLLDFLEGIIYNEVCIAGENPVNFLYTDTRLSHTCFKLYL